MSRVQPLVAQPARMHTHVFTRACTLRNGGHTLLPPAVREWVTRFSKQPDLVDLLAGGGTDAQDPASLANTTPSQPSADYAKHITLKEIQLGIKTGTVHQGKFHASRENSREGYVTVPGREQSILLQGVHMNRAIDGDVVAVQVFAEADWSAPSGESRPWVLRCTHLTLSAWLAGRARCVPVGRRFGGDHDLLLRVWATCIVCRRTST